MFWSFLNSLFGGKLFESFISFLCEIIKEQVLVSIKFNELDSTGKFINPSDFNLNFNRFIHFPFFILWMECIFNLVFVFVTLILNLILI